MSTVPSVSRMNVKFPINEPSLSNMSIQTIEQIPENYQQEATIIVDDTAHMVVDESKEEQKLQPIIVEETKILCKKWI